MQHCVYRSQGQQQRRDGVHILNFCATNPKLSLLVFCADTCRQQLSLATHSRRQLPHLLDRYVLYLVHIIMTDCRAQEAPLRSGRQARAAGSSQPAAVKK
jgi:hypothetical protein